MTLSRAARATRTNQPAAAIVIAAMKHEPDLIPRRRTAKSGSNTGQNAGTNTVALGAISLVAPNRRGSRGYRHTGGRHRKSSPRCFGRR